MDPVSIRQQYLKDNADMCHQWNEMFGQRVSVYRFISSEVPNIDKARRVYGAEKVQNNITKLTLVKTIKIPVAFDSFVNCYYHRDVTIDFFLPKDSLSIGDILILDYLGEKLEFIVEVPQQSQLETMFKYEIRTRASHKNHEVK